MCVIIHKPASAPIPSKLFQQSWDSNPHGAGIMWRTKSGVKSIKGLMTLAAFNKAIVDIPANVETAYHFRLATHGPIDKVNTHPWKVGKRSHMMHNGIIRGLDIDPEVSDSRLMADTLGDTATTSWWAVLALAGEHNKFIIMAPNITYRTGEWMSVGKVIVSNLTCMRQR